jgi:hypothetical protein
MTISEATSKGGWPCLARRRLQDRTGQDAVSLHSWLQCGVSLHQWSSSLQLHPGTARVPWNRFQQRCQRLTTGLPFPALRRHAGAQLAAAPGAGRAYLLLPRAAGHTHSHQPPQLRQRHGSHAAATRVQQASPTPAPPVMPCSACWQLAQHQVERHRQQAPSSPPIPTDAHLPSSTSHGPPSPLLSKL